MPCSVRVVVGAGEPVARLGSFWKLADDEVGLEKIPMLHDCLLTASFVHWPSLHTVTHTLQCSTYFYMICALHRFAALPATESSVLPVVPRKVVAEVSKIGNL